MGFVLAITIILIDVISMRFTIFIMIIINVTVIIIIIVYIFLEKPMIIIDRCYVLCLVT